MARKPASVIEDGYADLTKEIIYINDGERLTEEMAQAIAEEMERTSRQGASG